MTALLALTSFSLSPPFRQTEERAAHDLLRATRYPVISVVISRTLLSAMCSLLPFERRCSDHDRFGA